MSNYLLFICTVEGAVLLDFIMLLIMAKLSSFKFTVCLLSVDGGASGDNGMPFEIVPSADGDASPLLGTNLVGKFAGEYGVGLRLKSAVATENRRFFIGTSFAMSLDLPSSNRTQSDPHNEMSFTECNLSSIAASLSAIPKPFNSR